MAELIREQILLHTRQEIPHSVAITIEKIEETPKVTRVNAAINIERSSPKGYYYRQKRQYAQNYWFGCTPTKFKS